MINLIKKARTEGVMLDVREKYEEQCKIIKMILWLISNNSFSAVEVCEFGKIIAMVILGNSMLQSVWEEKLKELYADNDSVSWSIQYSEINYQYIWELMEKLGLSKVYSKYVRKYNLSIADNVRLDSNNLKTAENKFLFIMPIVEDGNLLLAEDSKGNTVWAYAVRNNQKGSISYRIYRRSAEGRIGMSTSLSPSVVNGLGNRISSIIEEYEGTFTSLHGTRATQRLWLWNLYRRAEPQEEIDDYSPSDVNDFLREFIEEYEGIPVEFGKEKSEPVYIQKMDDHINIGIWSDDMQKVFDFLEFNMKAKDWIREALHEKWVIAVPNGKKKDGTCAVRSGYNPSISARIEFKRKNRNERVYLLSFSEEEAEYIWSQYEERMQEHKNDEQIVTLEKGEE